MNGQLCRGVLLLVVGCGALAVACKGSGSSEPEPETTRETTAKAAGVALEEVSDPDWGYRIRVPVDAEQTEKGPSRQVWAWVYNDKVDSYTVMLEDHEVIDTREQARARVELVRAAENVVEARELEGGGFVVVMKEDEYVHYGEIWVFRKSATHHLLAICCGPAKGDTLMQMCSSLEVD